MVRTVSLFLASLMDMVHLNNKSMAHLLLARSTLLRLASLTHLSSNLSNSLRLEIAAVTMSRTLLHFPRLTQGRRLF